MAATEHGTMLTSLCNKHDGHSRAAGAAAQKRDNSKRDKSERHSRRKTRQRQANGSDEGFRRWDEPAAVGVVLGYETAAHGEGGVVHALGRGVVDDDGACRTAAS